MIRVFVDASVLFAASYSSTGASRELIRQALRGNLILVMSPMVVEEAETKLQAKAPAALPAFRQFLSAIPFEDARPTKRDVLRGASYTALKDAPIVAAAKRSRVDYLVGLDRRHLVDVPGVSEHSGIAIVLPEVLVEILRSRST